MARSADLNNVGVLSRLSMRVFRRRYTSSSFAACFSDSLIRFTATNAPWYQPSNTAPAAPPPNDRPVRTTSGSAESDPTHTCGSFASSAGGGLQSAL